MITLMQPERVCITVTLPVKSTQRGQQFVDKSAELEGQEIDRQFAAMVDDSAYQALNEQTAEAFGASDWQALLLAEKLLTSIVQDNRSTKPYASP